MAITRYDVLWHVTVKVCEKHYYTGSSYSLIALQLLLSLNVVMVKLHLAVKQCQYAVIPNVH